MFYSKRLGKDKKGLSDIVVTVSLVALAVVAVGIISGAIMKNVQNSAGKITAFDACKDIDIYTFGCVYDSSNVQIILKRGVGGASTKVSKLVQFFEKDGNSKNIIIANPLSIPAPLEKTSVQLSLVQRGLNQVFPPRSTYTVAYVLDNNGKETACRVSRKTECESGEIESNEGEK